MERRAPERPRAGLHGHLTVVARLAFALCAAALLLAAVIGGLLRAGVAVPLPAGQAWPGAAVTAHAFLMMSGFIGTVIALERAVALKARLAFAAPLLSALSGLVMLAGADAPASWLAVAAALVFIGVNVRIVDRQPAPHTALLLAGATAWLVGNVLLAVGGPTYAVLPWWFVFIVLTIAAERLEMTRLMRRRRGAAGLLHTTLAALLAGAAAFAVAPAWGGIVFGAALVGLAAWLLVFDIARRTVLARGLPRYMALCLLTGYAWLAVAGAAWMAAAWGIPARDTALHALGLGFVFSMMLGHAPVILPALARVKLQFGGFFYVPLVLLQASLVLRLVPGGLLDLGAAGNAAAIALFVATMAGAALRWRLHHPSSTSSRRHAPVAPARH